MRARRSRDEWATIIRAYDRTDESQRAFCAQRRLNLATFRWWRCTLQNSSAAAAPADVQVLPVEVVAPGEREPRFEPGHIVIAAGGAEICVAVGTDARYVAALVAELRRC